MNILALGATLERIEAEELAETNSAAVFFANSKEAAKAMELAGIIYEGEINLSSVGFCKIETQQECLAGSLCIPKLLDIPGRRYRVQFFINRRHIVIIDDDDFSWRLVMRIQRSKTKQGQTRERFLYNFLTQLMSRDLELLGSYEKKIMAMDEDVMDGKIDDFQNKISPVRKELLTLRGYYDEMMDMGRDLEENENGFFAKKQLKYFGTVADRADRLMGRTALCADPPGRSGEQISFI